MQRCAAPGFLTDRLTSFVAHDYAETSRFRHKRRHFRVGLVSRSNINRQSAIMFRAVALYEDANTSENYSELSAAKGKYVG
ncbi:MAG: hypothetical protein LH614_21890 [Pyrinomonadaceae bacterium]|nr:hypothetical protein [Pyrinomonadaceae bacterium]